MFNCNLSQSAVAVGGIAVRTGQSGLRLNRSRIGHVMRVLFIGKQKV